MSHSTSGRNGFDYLNSEIDIIELMKQLNISFDTLLQIIERENELRTCEEYQLKYGSIVSRDGFFGYASVTEEIQKQVNFKHSIIF